MQNKSSKEILDKAKINASEWVEENKKDNQGDAIKIIDQAIEILNSLDRDGAIQATAEYLAAQEIDLLDLLNTDKRLPDYLRTRRGMEGNMNALRSAIDLAHASRTVKDDEHRNKKYEKIIESTHRSLEEVEDRKKNPVEVKNEEVETNKRHPGIREFVDAVVKLQTWEEFINILAAVNRKKQFFKDADFDLLRKKSTKVREIDGLHQTIIRKLIGKLDKAKELDEFIELYRVEYDQESAKHEDVEGA